MERINELEKNEKIQQNHPSLYNIGKNYNTLYNQKIIIPKEKKEEKNNINKEELNKKIFKIIQQKGNINEINNNFSSNENQNKNSSDILDDEDEKKINEDNVNNNVNDKKKDDIKVDIPEKKYKNEEYNINNYDGEKKLDKNNKNVYTLLNSYYKDINLNFKNNNISNNGKNFLRKNNFQESSNKKNFQYNKQNSYSNFPYIFNQNQFYNNIYLYNNQISTYIFPENAFTINNSNNIFSNNIKYYNYNNNIHFRNKKKFNKKNIDNIERNFFIINLENILMGIDKRTTIMIRHIPNKYSYNILLEEINTVCKNKYDFFYLPLDSENNCNLGYAFINFINPLHIIYFYNIFKSRKWLHFNSYKECDLSFAKYQGKNELILNFEKNMGKSDDKRRIPIILEVKNPPKIDLFKQYYEIIEKYRPELLNDINWI